MGRIGFHGQPWQQQGTQGRLDDCTEAQRWKPLKRRYETCRRLVRAMSERAFVWKDMNPEVNLYITCSRRIPSIKISSMQMHMYLFHSFVGLLKHHPSLRQYISGVWGDYRLHLNMIMYRPYQSFAFSLRYRSLPSCRSRRGQLQRTFERTAWLFVPFARLRCRRTLLATSSEHLFAVWELPSRSLVPLRQSSGPCRIM